MDMVVVGEAVLDVEGLVVCDEVLDNVAAAVVAVDVEVVVDVVMVVVWHRPAPGWQSGTSPCPGHCNPAPVAARVTKIVRPRPFSHCVVHALYVYSQSCINVGIVCVVVVVVVVVVVLQNKRHAEYALK